MRFLTAEVSRSIIRVALCALVFVHGPWGAAQGSVAPFGEWLLSKGVPFGSQAALGVTAYEFLAAPGLAFGLMRALPAMAFAAISAAGLVTVHAPFGWFVVGAGRNGIGYSALLSACFLIAGWTRSSRSAAAR